MLIIIIGTIISLLGTIMIFDARYLTKKFFSFSDQNEGANGLKIIGLFIAVIGGLLIYFKPY